MDEVKTNEPRSSLNSGYKLGTSHDLLLGACLLKGGSAIECFHEWKDSVDLGNVDPASYRLFPLLYKNLTSEGVQDPVINIFKWVYEKTSKNNSTLLMNLAPVMEEFNKREIEVILLKGSGLILTSYGDLGLRPMLDADLLVPTDKTREAIRLITELGWEPSITPLKGFKDMALLSKLGWTPAERKLEDFSDEYFCVRHGQDFTNPEKFTIDLHWHVLHGYNSPVADEDFWKGSNEVNVKGIKARVLCPSDFLLHVCTHGTRWDVLPSIRWVADAASIIQNQEVDWEKFVEAAARHEKTLQTKDALQYLKRYLPDEVTDWVLTELDDVQVTKEEYKEYSLRSRPPGIMDGLYELRFLYSNYSKLNPDRGFLSKITGYPRFLQHIFGMEKLRHLFLYAGFELIRRGAQLPRSIMSGTKQKSKER